MGTLYAQWKIPTYTVTYNSNGASSGSAPTDPNAYRNGDTVTVLSNTGSMALSDPMLGGYTFAGWNTALDGTGTQQATGSTFTMGSDNVTLYAQWTLIPTYTVTYNSNGASSGSAPTDPNAYRNG